MATAKIEKIGRVSNESVLKGTGKPWDHWLRVIEKAGGRSMSHREIVQFLKTKHKLGPWWRQGVAAGYEMHIGKRVEGRNQKGEYSCTITRTLPIAQRALWKFLQTEDGVGAWLGAMSPFEFAKGCQFEIEGGVFGEVRTLKSPERMRMTWQDSDWPKASIVQLFIVPRPGSKCILAVMHEKLSSDRLKEEMRAYWKSRFDLVARALPAVRA